MRTEEQSELNPKLCLSSAQSTVLTTHSSCWHLGIVDQPEKNEFSKRLFLFNIVFKNKDRASLAQSVPNDPLFRLAVSPEVCLPNFSQSMLSPQCVSPGLRSPPSTP